MDTLERLKPRVWVPFRVAFEFHRRWREVDQANRDAYEQLSDQIASEGRSLTGLFEKYTRHQIIDVKKEQKEITDFISALCERLKENKKQHPPRSEAEAIFLTISELIGEAVGRRPSHDEMEKLIKEGETRYEKQVPPGFKDGKTKDGSDKYGDFFIWNEIIDKAKNDQKPIVMITDDIKEDWWTEFRGEKLGPRPELVEELAERTQQQFYLYTLSQFLDYASKHLNRAVDNDAIEEIKTDEIQQRRAFSEITRFKFRERSTNSERLLQRKRIDLSMMLRKIDDELVSLGNDGSTQTAELVKSLVARRTNLELEIRQIRAILRNIQQHKEHILQNLGINPNLHRVPSPEIKSSNFLFAEASEGDAPTSIDWDQDDTEK